MHMKKVFLSLAALSCMSLSLSAQVKAYQSATIPSGNSVAYSLPRTVLKVTVVAEKESIRRGPYARFAQKYLGVMAPTVDKDLYTVVGGSIGYADEADPAAVYVLDNPDKSAGRIYTVTPEGLVAAPMEGAPMPDKAPMPPVAGPMKPGKPGGVEVLSYVTSDTSFVNVQVDKRSVIDQSPESMAQQAANTIFTLRKRRMELVTGEFGENVFGEGLAAALREIDRLEQEYTALFLGKQFKQRIVKTYDVIPEMGKNTAVVCRFTETGGLLPAGDLSGTPIGVDMIPENKLENSPWTRRTSKDSRGMVFYRIADMVNCRLMDGQKELTQRRIPIYQFGLTVEMPATSLK